MTQPPAFLLEDGQGEQHAFPGSKPAFVCFVKEDCPTCNDVMPLIEAAWGGLREGKEERNQGSMKR